MNTSIKLRLVNAPQFFEYARERYRILQRKRKGLPKPWTNDPILQRYRFCNVFREDDKVTEWYRKHIREPYQSDPAIVLATIIFRFINRISTAEIMNEERLFTSWDPGRARRILTGVRPLVGAAYLIRTPLGVKPKLEGLIQIFDAIADNPYLAQEVRNLTTMRDLVRYLCRYHCVGSFYAYEVACDLQYTDWFSPTDTMEWANPGPGCARGLDRLVFGALGPLAKRRRADQEKVQELMRTLLHMSQQQNSWPQSYPGWPRWDMRTVEHTLCEFDKYERVRRGEGKPKVGYNGRAES
jgi:5-hmdU DNA kinase, helical domain